MTDYIPGSAYSEGFKARMKGVPKNSVSNEQPVYLQEWVAGWEDAHKKIIEDARSTVGIEKYPGSFIQD